MSQNLLEAHGYIAYARSLQATLNSNSLQHANDPPPLRTPTDKVAQGPSTDTLVTFKTEQRVTRYPKPQETAMLAQCGGQ